MKEAQLFQKLSIIFDYPGMGFFKELEDTEAIIKQSFSDYYLTWLNSTMTIRNLKIGAIQEEYIASFDVKASSSLDVGHVLFGEDKKRNNFLIHLREEHEKIKHDCGKEMPDYLPNLLQLLSRSSDEELNEELTMSIILPALRLMNAGLDSKLNPYSGLFVLLIEIIENKFQDSSFAEYKPVGKTTCNFSKSHCHHG